MDPAATPSRTARPRFRHRAHRVPRSEEREPRANQKEDHTARDAWDEGQTESDSMGKDHRSFHRRAPQAAIEIVTVNVEVIATVDAEGNILSQETVTQPDLTLPTSTISVPLVPSIVGEILPSEPAIIAAVPSVPSVPAPPTQTLPSVPSVPPFPSDLRVPSVPPYPWPSGDPAAVAAASANAAITTPATTNTAGSTVVSVTISSDLNSTTASTTASPSMSSFTSATSISPSSTSQSFETRDSSTLDATPSASDAAFTSYYGGGGAPGNPGASPAATAAIAGGNANDSPAPLETPQVVGSIVGSLAGAALILAIILLLIRRHKRRRGGALQLTGDDHTDANEPMRQAPASAGLVPSAFLNRFSGMSKSTADTSTSGGERSFQRVSGRKLPSAFSEGMTSDQFSRGAGTMSGSSFYQDDQGIYGGPGLSKEFGKEIGDISNPRTSGPLNFRPSPARTPIIRHPDDAPVFGTNQSHLSPPQSPNPEFASRGTLGRSHPSADGSRSSRFTENV